MRAVGECGAFYGILLGHDDHLGARELQVLPAGSGDGRETRCVRARMPSAREVLEEALRDCRCPRSPRPARPRAASAKSCGASSWLPGERDEALAARGASRSGASPATSSTHAAVHDDRVDLAQPRHAARAAGPRAAAGRCRSPLAVDHRDLDVARERVVLQAVVAHQHVDLGMRLEQRARGRGAVGRDVHRHARAPRDQHRLVAEMLGRRHVGIDAHHAARDRARAAARARSRARPRRALKPLRCSSSTIAIASGVLPVPPAEMLPTTITGTRRAPRGQQARAIERAAQRRPRSGRASANGRKTQRAARPASATPTGATASSMATPRGRA